MFRFNLSRTSLFWLMLPLVVMVSGFNLSPKHAIVFKDPSGQQRSYFGYTVALAEENFDAHWLVVGAPRGNSTRPSHLNIMEPGVVYQCQLEQMKCAPKLLDSAGNDQNNENKYLQHKDNAWIGASVDLANVEEEQIVVCGPRWMNYYHTNDMHAYINGICYISDISKTESDAEKLLPLIKRSDRFYKKKPTDTNLVKEDSFFYAFGQAGISAHFTKEGDEILVGAPGVFDWTGTVLRYNINDKQNPIIPNPLRTPVLKEYSYLGYSLASGNFLSGQKHKTLYVSGAPRAGTKFQGKVFIFDYHVSTGENDEHRLEVVQELEGKDMGEYYGAAVCVVDLNGDGLDDILVGAPRFGYKQAWDQGRIYIHLRMENNGNPWFSSTQVVGSRQSGAQYGTAIASLGDIDRDGYNDFAVGAPYEDSGTGVIYIYHGAQEGPRKEFSLRIVGREIDHDILGFGISFSRSLDVDGNNYPDVAVGAYMSGHVTVIKSYPVITYEATISTSVTSIGFSATNFNITACIMYKGKYAPSPVSTLLTLTLDEIYQRVRPRRVTNELQIINEQQRCMEHNVQIERMLQDFSKPIELKMDYRLKENKSDGEFCKFCPVVDPRKPRTLVKRLPYATGCESNNMCKPELKVTAEFINVTTPLIIGTQPTVSIRVSVENTGEPAFLAYAFISLPESCSLVRASQSCEVVDGAGPLSEKQLKCLMENPLKTKKTVHLDVDIKGVQSGTELLLFLVNATSAGAEKTPENNFWYLELPLITQTDIGLVGIPNQEEIVYSKQNKTVETETTFLHTYEVKNYGPSPVNTMGLEFQIPVSIAAGGNFIEIHEIQARESILITCTRSDRPSLYTRRAFENPINDSESSSTTEENTSFSNYDDRHEEGFTESSDYVYNTSIPEDIEPKEKQLNTRSESGIPEQKRYPTDRVLSINCEQSGTKCVTVQCSIYGQFGTQSKVSVFISMVAKFKQLESVLGNRDIILYSTTGKATIKSPLNVQEAEENRPDEVYVTTAFHGRIKEGGLDYAILGAAIGGAFLLLIIIVIILWQAGFFKRKNPTEQYKALKQRNLDD